MNPRDLYYIVSRKMAEPFVSSISKTNITPNKVTTLNFLLFIPLTTFFFALGGYLTNLIALILLSLYSFVDFMDGMLARMKSMQTATGAWLDSTLDVIACSCVLIGITIGLFNSGNRLSLFGIYIFKIPDTIVLTTGLVALFAQLMTTLFMNELEHKYILWSNVSKIEEKFATINEISSREKLIKSIVLPFSWSWLLFGYAVPIAVGTILNVTFISLVLIAIMQNLRAILLAYVLFSSFQGNELLLIKVAKDIAKSNRTHD